MDPRVRCDASAAGGALLWLGAVWFASVDLVSMAVLFAVLVLVPLALPIAARSLRDGFRTRPFRWVTVAQPPAAVLFAASTVVATSGGAGGRGPALAAALAVPWVGVAGLLAWVGLRRFATRGPSPVEETVLDAGLVYLLVGALAAVAWRLDVGLGYDPTIVHLTVAHYHYATFLLPVVVAALGRYRRPGPLYRGAAVVLVAGVPLVAAGITASPPLEAVAGTLFAAAVVVVAALFLGVAREQVGHDQGAAALLIVAAVSAGLAMALAVAYAVGQWIGPPSISVSAMIRTHGLLNAFGFTLPAVLAWRRLLGAGSRTAPPDTHPSGAAPAPGER